MHIEQYAHLPILTEELLQQLKEVIQQGSCTPLIEYIQRNIIPNLRSAVNENEFEASYIDSIYQFSLELAISLSEDDFIKDVLSNEEFIQHINEAALIEYAKNKDFEFKKILVIGLINNSKNFTEEYMGNVFRETINRFFSERVRNNPHVNTQTKSDDIILIETILLSSEIKADKKNPYFADWINEISWQLERSNDRQMLISTLLTFLPLEKQMLSSVLTILLSITNITDEELLSVIMHIQHRIDSNHAIFKYYAAVSKILMLSQPLRSSVIIERPELISVEYSDTEFQHFLYSSLDVAGRKNIVNLYISRPDIFFNPIAIAFMWKEVWHDEADAIQYLSAPHTQLPYNILDELVRSRAIFNDFLQVLRLLFSRADYKISEAIFDPLCALFQGNEAQPIKIILEQSSTYDLFKQYYFLNGDEKITFNTALLPSVVAWYMTFSNRSRELFLSYTPEQQKKILKGFVPRFIDMEQPSLERYAVKLGYFEFLDAVGGINTRFLQVNSSANLIVYAPKPWRDSQAIKVLRRFQQRVAVSFAKSRIDAMTSHAVSSTEEIKTLAQAIVDKCHLKTLTLQHQTTPQSVRCILADNSFKTPQHIQKNHFGKGTTGIIKAGTTNIRPKTFAFSFFTRLPSLQDEKTRITYFSGTPTSTISRFVLNGGQLLAENPQIRILMVAPYPGLQESKSLTLPGGHELVSKPNDNQGSRYKRAIAIHSPETALQTIYQTLCEIALEQFIMPLEEPLRSTTLEKLTNPKTEEDQELANKLINLLHQEWLLPGDIPLSLSFVDLIEHEEKNYDFIRLRHAAEHGTESEVLIAMDTFKDLTMFTFALKGIRAISLQRGHRRVFDKAMQMIKKDDNDITYYPNEVYQIEGLVQLILEDLSDRVYLHYTTNSIIFYSTLRNNNVNGAHHAEMVKLRYALGDNSFQNKNALKIQLENTFTIMIGADEKFKNLSELRNALLKYELTTLLVCKQNEQYYLDNNGEFHPITGKGATNGTVALLADRLFANGDAYQINITYNEITNNIELTTTDPRTSQFIATTIQTILEIPAECFLVENDVICINTTPKELIAKLRGKATFYEGINVFTDDGKLLVAKRNDKGWASAGGHHGEKYTPEGIAYGLRSEFDLKVKDPKNIARVVTILKKESDQYRTPNGVTVVKENKNTIKTGIYIIQTEALVPTSKAQSYAGHKLDFPFYADPEEFVMGSEVIMGSIDMRGQCFYDVMPIAELYKYQLLLLKNYIEKIYPELCDEMSFTINVDCEHIPELQQKIPSNNFGQIRITCKGYLPEQIENTLANYEVFNENDLMNRVFIADENPQAIIKMIKEAEVIATSTMNYS